ncbi:MAG: radical SAM protein [Duodenibacillus sp.]|nr:radical SAM protein [Duodenibacillus sp.]
MATILFPSPIFGPVKSRRLGVSLGLNLLPSDGKICNFDCVYCECGLNAEHRPKQDMPTRRQVALALEAKLKAMLEAGDTIDAITFAGNGEPTSHPDFKEIVDDVMAIRDRYFPNATVCLLTNATNILKPSVRRAVESIDRACLKLDSVDIDYVRFVNRPTCVYRLDELLEAMRSIGKKCVIQTMFLKGTWEGQCVDNTGEVAVQAWLEAIRTINPNGVDLYTISRDTPAKTLQKAGAEELDRIADRVRALGISAHAYY